MNAKTQNESFYRSKKIKCACGGLCEGKCRDEHFWKPSRLKLNKKQNTFEYKSPICPEIIEERPNETY